MEFVTGLIQPTSKEISELMAPEMDGAQVVVNGAVHTVRDMGEVAFVVLRKREGLLQCVF